MFLSFLVASVLSMHGLYAGSINVQMMIVTIVSSILMKTFDHVSW